MTIDLNTVKPGDRILVNKNAIWYLTRQESESPLITVKTIKRDLDPISGREFPFSIVFEGTDEPRLFTPDGKWSRMNSKFDILAIVHADPWGQLAPVDLHTAAAGDTVLIDSEALPFYKTESTVLTIKEITKQRKLLRCFRIEFEETSVVTFYTPEGYLHVDNTEPSLSLQQLIKKKPVPFDHLMPLEQIEPVPLPDGWYVGFATDSVIETDGPETPGERLILTYQVRLGAGTYSEVKYTIELEKTGQSLSYHCSHFLACLCKAADITLLSDTEQLHDILMRIRVVKGEIRAVRKFKVKTDQIDKICVNSAFGKTASVHHQTIGRENWTKVKEACMQEMEATSKRLDEWRVKDEMAAEQVSNAIRPTQSAVLHHQKVGRAYRPTQDEVLHYTISKCSNDSPTDIANQPHSLGPNMRKIWESYHDRGVFGVSVALTYSKPGDKLRIYGTPVDTVFEDGQATTMWQTHCLNRKVKDGELVRLTRGELHQFLNQGYGGGGARSDAPVVTSITSQQCNIAHAVLGCENYSHEAMNRVLNALMRDMEIAEKEVAPSKYENCTNLLKMDATLTSQWGG